MTAPTYERPWGSCGTPSLRPQRKNTRSQSHKSNYRGVICNESGCTSEATARGWCSKHYRQHWRAQQHDRTSAMWAVAVAERITVGADGCWMWSGPLTAAGEPVVTVLGRQRRAVAIVWSIAFGAELGRARVGRTCVNRRVCLNPAHFVRVGDGVSIAGDDDLLECSRCGQVRPGRMFGINVRSKKGRGRNTWCSECMTEHNRLRRGVSPEAAAMRPPLDAACAICGSAAQVHLDHDPRSGAFRGWLCQSCNTALGLFADDPDRLRAAADYLDSSRKP